MKAVPFIWLQEDESSASADCGCVLKHEGRGPPMFLCPMHRTAPDLLAASKALVEAISPQDVGFGKLFDAARAAIAKAEGQS